MVEGYTRPVKSLEVLSFLLQDFEAIFLDSLVVHQLSLEQAGCGGRREKGKGLSYSRLQVSLFGSFSLSRKDGVVLGLYVGVYCCGICHQVI